ncbi:MAG TPA: TolC family protein [Candidatus Polarisedimenticolia bacterium]|nr:TolC family protein [Candidatus Polarisedimenticolia bacterium]
MRRRAAHRAFWLSLTLLLLAPLAPPGAAAGQGAPTAPPGDTPQPGTPPTAGTEEPPGGTEGAPLSLAACLKAALENNLDIAVRRYDPLRGASRVTLSESAFDPSITASALKSEDQQKRISAFIGPYSSREKARSYTAAFVDPLTTGGNYRVDLAADDNTTSTSNVFGANTSTGYNTTWQVTFTQPLWRGLGPKANRWLIVVARNSQGINEAQFRQTVIDTLASAEKAYWDLNFALMDLKTKRGSLQLARDFLEQNRIKVRVGTLAPIEITQAEAGVADREEGVIIAENVLRTAEDALRRIMNVPSDSPMWGQPIHPTDAPLLVEVAPVMEEAVTAAEKNRPDLEQARLSVRSGEVELGYRRNQRRWGLDFQGDYGLLGFDLNNYSDSFSDLRDRNQKNWKLGLNLTIPLGNRQAVANFTNAEYALTQSRYDLQRLEQAARVEVRNAVRLVETNLKRVKAAQVNVRLQREKLEAEQKKFENGMSTSFQVLQFQTDLASAESRENQAIVDYNKSIVELERVKGTLLEAKEMVMPGVPPGGGPVESPGSAGAAAGDEEGVAFLTPGDRVTLPTDFVLAGKRLLGVGGIDSSGRRD